MRSQNSAVLALLAVLLLAFRVRAAGSDDLHEELVDVEAGLGRALDEDARSDNPGHLLTL